MAFVNPPGESFEILCGAELAQGPKPDNHVVIEGVPHAFQRLLGHLKSRKR